MKEQHKDVILKNTTQEKQFGEGGLNCSKVRFKTFKGASLKDVDLRWVWVGPALDK